MKKFSIGFLAGVILTAITAYLTTTPPKSTQPQQKPPTGLRPKGHGGLAGWGPEHDIARPMFARLALIKDHDIFPLAFGDTETLKSAFKNKYGQAEIDGKWQSVQHNYGNLFKIVAADGNPADFELLAPYCSEATSAIAAHAVGELTPYLNRLYVAGSPIILSQYDTNDAIVLTKKGKELTGIWERDNVWNPLLCLVSDIEHGEFHSDFIADMCRVLYVAEKSLAARKLKGRYVSQIIQSSYTKFTAEFSLRRH